jgi:hypothetical protein
VSWLTLAFLCLLTIVTSIFALARVLNAYFIVAFIFADVFTWRVMGFEASALLCEVLRFFGITTLIIASIHAAVASHYPPETMLREAARIQALYYFVFAIALWKLMPSELWTVRLHALVVAAVGALFLLAPNMARRQIMRKSSRT